MVRVVYSPVKLFARLFFVSVAALWLAHLSQNALIRTVLPMIHATIDIVQSDFVIQSLDIQNDGSGDRLCLDANLTRPVEIGGRIFYPMGYGASQRGGLQVTMTLGGVLIYSLLLLIVVLTWPFKRWSELARRLVFAAPAMLLLVLVNVAVTYPAELWIPVHEQWVPDVNWPLLQWSRVLMGGGGLMLGLFCGVLIVMGCSADHWPAESSRCLTPQVDLQ